MLLSLLKDGSFGISSQSLATVHQSLQSTQSAHLSHHLTLMMYIDICLLFLLLLSKALNADVIRVFCFPGFRYWHVSLPQSLDLLFIVNSIIPQMHGKSIYCVKGGCYFMGLLIRLLNLADARADLHFFYQLSDILQLDMGDLQLELIKLRMKGLIFLVLVSWVPNCSSGLKHKGVQM